MIGQSIAHFKITEKIGEGGMGEVYRATDSKLNRDVALKLLPPRFAQDPQRMTRFAREAQVLASLNHPNIAAIYGLEESAEKRALVLELVEGPTLEDRIESGKVSLDEALGIALQITEALETAHEKGIVHRDLKPANVKLSADGTVKVLDFGLAKALEAEIEENQDPTHSPTLTMAATQAGIILGTAAYMSPEQASAGYVDQRSDIWSFGVILFELLSGRRLFSGQTVSHTLAEVLKTEPNWDDIPADMPNQIRLLLERCLRKNSRNRLQSIGDARVLIEEYLANPEEESLKPEVLPRKTSWKLLVPAGLVLMLLAFLLGWMFEFPFRPQEPPVRLSVELTEGGLMTDYGTSAVLSPDGSTLAYVGGAWPNTQLFVRQMSQFESRPLAGTEGAYHPFFSPDGKWIGFVTREALKKVAVMGGAPLKLCQLLRNRGATWTPDDRIIYSSGPNTGLFWVSSAGGEPQPLSELDSESGEYTHRWPQVLPDGRSILFTSHQSSSNFDSATIEALNLESGERKIIHRGGSQARYTASGHLVYVREGTLFAAPFDLGDLEMTGDPSPVLEGVSSNPQQHGSAQFSFSDTGELLYLTGAPGSTRISLYHVPASEEISQITDRSGVFYYPRYSPDGSKIALTIETEGNEDVWVLDVTRNALTRLTFDPLVDSSPVWSPDGRYIVFSSARNGSENVFMRPSDGSGDLLQLTSSELDQRPSSFSPDGRYLLITQQSESDQSAGPDIWVLDVESKETTALIESPFSEIDARFSPDGRWISYASNESGRMEVYVRPFPERGGRWQVSTSGGFDATWSPDGKAIFYSWLETIYTTEVKPLQSSLEIGNPVVYRELDSLIYFDVHPSGEHAVASAFTDSREGVKTHGKIVFNWFDELERLVPTK